MRFEHGRRNADKRSKAAQANRASLAELAEYRPMTPGQLARTSRAVGYGHARTAVTR